jgi:hypothetical protein
MANFVTKTAKKAVRKTTRKAVKAGTNYAKGYIAKAFLCWAIAAVIGLLPQFGIVLPDFLTGTDTVAMIAFIVVGIVIFGRKVSMGRLIALVRTFLN